MLLHTIPIRRPIVAASLVLATVAMPSTTPAQGVLEPIGLDGRVVTTLDCDRVLHAGTLDHGAFRLDLANPAGWVSLGPGDADVRAVLAADSGSAQSGVIAGLEREALDPDSARLLHRSNTIPSWVATDGGMHRPDVTMVASLAAFVGPLHAGVTFATSSGPAGGVWRRAAADSPWVFVVNVGFGVGNVVRVGQTSGHVWAGGENALLAPWIARSTDGGLNWRVDYLDLGGDNACNTIALHPDDPSIAYAGMEGPLLKTTDGGATWAPTGLGATEAYIYGVALDSYAPTHLLAGGMIQQPNNWALWESFDSGASWAPIPAPEVPGGASGILAIAADPVRPGTFYLATRGHGVWRYRNAALEAGPKPALHGGIRFATGWPNPTRGGIAFVLEVPAAAAGTYARVTIRGARGERVRALPERSLGAGRSVLRWDGRDDDGRPVAPGVYWCELRVEDGITSRRFSLVR